MAEMLRILERFRVCGLRTAYRVRIFAPGDIRMGDVLYDLHGNRFRINGMEMIRRIPGSEDSEDGRTVLCFELLNGIEPEGNILLRSLTDVSFLFCNDPFHPKMVDEDYREEYQAAGLEHACTLFSYEDLEDGKLSLYGEPVSGLTIYRGWMMKPELYRTFYRLLEEKNIFLINTPEEYERYHMLPGWYDDFREDTPASSWEELGTLESAMTLTSGLKGPYIVKDFVKSRKHEWYDACFIREIGNRADAEKVIGTFIERQDTDLVGGVVLRRFVKLRQIGWHEKSGMPISEEYRIFVLAGKIMTVGNYWQKGDADGFTEEERRWMEASVKKLRSNFVTMDIARCEDGRLIIMEFGDGQVSDLQQTDLSAFYRAFHPDV